MVTSCGSRQKEGGILKITTTRPKHSWVILELRWESGPRENVYSASTVTVSRYYITKLLRFRLKGKCVKMLLVIAYPNITRTSLISEKSTSHRGSHLGNDFSTGAKIHLVAGQPINSRIEESGNHCAMTFRPFYCQCRMDQTRSVKIEGVIRFVQL